MSNFTSSLQEDSTPTTITSTEGASILSAYFGLDNSSQIGGNGLFAALCGDFPTKSGLDGMPLVLSREIDPFTLEAGDFLVNNSTTPVCVTLLPARNVGELRTVLLIGEFNGNNASDPTDVCITGNIWDKCHTITFQGVCADAIPLSATPSLVLGEILPPDQAADLNEDCVNPVRAVWNGGVTAHGFTTEEATASYTVTLSDGTTLQPTLLLDYAGNPTDNNHVLCFNNSTSSSGWSDDNPPISLTSAAGIWQDPNVDGVNEETSIAISMAVACEDAAMDPTSNGSTTATSGASFGAGNPNIAWMIWVMLAMMMWKKV